MFSTSRRGAPAEAGRGARRRPFGGTMGGPMKRLLVLFALGVAGCSDAARIVKPLANPRSAPAFATAPAGVPAPPAGFTLTWSDDFTGGANTGLNTTDWKYDVGP